MIMHRSKICSAPELCCAGYSSWDSSRKLISSIISINNNHWWFFLLVKLSTLAHVQVSMITASNGNIFRVTGPLRGELTGHRWIPLTMVTRSFDFFYLRMNKRLSKQSKRWWFETPSLSLWRHCNVKLAMMLQIRGYKDPTFIPIMVLPTQWWHIIQVVRHKVQSTKYDTFCLFTLTLLWRHNERDGVSNHLGLDCLLNRLFRRRSNKTSKLRVTGLCEGNSPVIGEFLAQRASNTENVSIWWRHDMFHCYTRTRDIYVHGVQ